MKHHFDSCSTNQCPPITSTQINHIQQQKLQRFIQYSTTTVQYSKNVPTLPALNLSADTILRQVLHLTQNQKKTELSVSTKVIILCTLTTPTRSTDNRRQQAESYHDAQPESPVARQCLPLGSLAQGTPYLRLEQIVCGVQPQQRWGQGRHEPRRAIHIPLARIPTLDLRGDGPCLYSIQ